jgi:hypothetical protein
MQYSLSYTRLPDYHLAPSKLHHMDVTSFLRSEHTSCANLILVKPIRAASIEEPLCGVYLNLYPFPVGAAVVELGS